MSRILNRILSRRSSKSRSRDNVSVPQFRTIADRFRSLEEVREELRRNGLESSNLIVGVDFTKSNEWTGRISFQGRSLHTIGPVPNPYEEAIRTICKTLEFCDEDNQIPCYGFGDATTHDKDVFSFFPDDQPSPGLDAALQQYRELAPIVKLAGPTSFAPLIRQAIRIVIESGMQYHILLIVADGQVTRSVDTPEGAWSTQEAATIEALVDASKVPLSIVMVGVGDGPWDMMEEFDDKLPQRDFDNFQFVNFTEITMQTRTNPVERREALFALNALMEIPEQYKTIINTNLLGGAAPPLKLTPAPLPPPLPTQVAPSRALSLAYTHRTTSIPYGNSSRSFASYSGYDINEEPWDTMEAQHPMLGPPAAGVTRQYSNMQEGASEGTRFGNGGLSPRGLDSRTASQSSLASGSYSGRGQQQQFHNTMSPPPTPPLHGGQHWVSTTPVMDKENQPRPSTQVNVNNNERSVEASGASTSRDSICLKPMNSSASTSAGQLSALDSASSTINVVCAPSSPSDAANTKMFLCPITKGLMRDPVIAADGYTYEKAAIENWFMTKSTSPMTQQPLQHKMCIPNNLLKSAIQDYLDNHAPSPSSPPTKVVEPRPSDTQPAARSSDTKSTKPVKREPVLDSVLLLDAPAATYNTPFVTSLYSPFVYDGGEPSCSADKLPQIPPRKGQSRALHTGISFVINQSDDESDFHDAEETFDPTDVSVPFEGFRICR